MAPVHALGALRHACHGCGACCTGHAVRLIRDEPARIAQYAAQLGVSNPVKAGPRGPVLAFVDQRCPFLDASRRCRIHGTFGAQLKPAVCQQYPLRSIVTESGQRVAVDPGCGSNWMVWQDGPELDPSGLLPAPDRTHSHQEAQVERSLVGLLAPSLDPDALARVVGALSGRPPTEASLHAFSERAAAAVRELALPTLLPKHAPTLMPWLSSLEVPDAPTWPELTPEQQGFTLEMARRSVFLRSGTIRPMGVGLALGTVVGALVCGWSHSEPDAFGPALSAWTRLLRLPPVWMALYPDPMAVRRLATGA